MKYTKLHYLMNEEHCIVEIKDEKSNNHWLSISKETNFVANLELLKESEEVIKGNKMKVKDFTDGELRFDEKYGKLIVANNGYILLNCSKESLPSDIDKLILGSLG